MEGEKKFYESRREKRKYFSDIKPVLSSEKKGQKQAEEKEYAKPRSNKTSYSFDIANRNKGPVKPFNRTIDLRGMDEDYSENNDETLNEAGNKEELIEIDNIEEHKAEEE